MIDLHYSTFVRKRLLKNKLKSAGLPVLALHCIKGIVEKTLNNQRNLMHSHF